MTVRYRLGESGKLLFIVYVGMYNRWTIYIPEETANDINNNLHYKYLLIGYGQNIINMDQKPHLVVIPPDVLTISVPSRSKPILKCDIPLKLIKNKIKFIPSGQTEEVQVNQMLLDEYREYKEQQQDEDILESMINNIII